MRKTILLSLILLASNAKADFKVDGNVVVGNQQNKPVMQGGALSQANLGAYPWDISKRDGNLRNVLTRWGGVVEPKWKVVWQAPRDLDVDGDERFAGDFKTAVRTLLKSTSLTDMELQPCFHTNNVVRIVKKTTRCDPNN